MATLLNYKYEIFPTRPQRYQLNRIMREGRYQWNKAVFIRKKLVRALNKGEFEYVVNAFLTGQKRKNNKQGNRKNAITKVLNKLKIPFDMAAKVYDLQKIVSPSAVPDTDLIKYIDDIPALASKLKDIDAEQRKACEAEKRANDEKARSHREKWDRQEAKRLKKGEDPRQYKSIELSVKTKITVYYKMLDGINAFAGEAGKHYVDQSYKKNAKAAKAPRNGLTSGKDSRWKTATISSQKQRKHGKTGNPKFKRRNDSFRLHFSGAKRSKSDLIRDVKAGKQVLISPLPKGMEWINIAYHRPVPTGAEIAQISVIQKSAHYFVVLTLNIDDADATIQRKNDFVIGIDPGARTPLVAGCMDLNSGGLLGLNFEYSFIDRAESRLAKVQRKLDRKRGPKKKTSGGGWGRQKPSKAWIRLNTERTELHYRIGNKRRDVRHKISRFLTENFELIGVGHWEAEREISYRKKVKELEKRIRLGDSGAEAELKALKESKSKNGRKGAKKARKGGRDRSTATIRRYIEEKAQRSGSIVNTHVNEAGSTMSCCICGQKTGPTGQAGLSEREWTCENCGTSHNRDLNGAFNILLKTADSVVRAENKSCGDADLPSVIMRHLSAGYNHDGCGMAETRSARSQSQGGSKLSQVLPTGADGNATPISHKNMFSDNKLWPVLSYGAGKSLKEMGIISTLSRQKLEKNALKPVKKPKTEIKKPVKILNQYEQLQIFE